MSLRTRRALAGSSALSLCLTLWLPAPTISAGDPNSAPPSPLAPIPSPRQLAWHQRQQYAFIHFGINTFTDREWGTGKEDPSSFNPSELDARQWARTVKDAGFKMIVLTCKHHDGFCLWPSRYTEHSVKNSPWREGKGDVVREVSEACREFGLKFGVYLSPWDRHEPSYGDSPRYNEHYKNQLRELLTNYGEVAMVWFDGANGEGPNGKRQVYDWAGYIELVRQLQPSATIFSDAGPDVRWVGNESGLAGETNWCLYDRCRVSVGGGVQEQMGKGDPNGPDWIPAECDVSIRPGWFNHPSEDGKVKPLKQLLDIYYRSVGQNAALHLNIPPNRQGLISDGDRARLKEWRQELDEAFAHDLARGKRVTASNVRGRNAAFAGRRAVDGHWDTYWATDDGVTTAWLEVDLGKSTAFNRALVQEYVQLGQRVAAFAIERWDGTAWQVITQATTIGYQRILRFPEVTAQRVRLVIQSARGCPTIATFGLFDAPREDKL